ncbi:unnamed protein product, partial [Candidula unifasciata]
PITAPTSAHTTAPTSAHTTAPTSAHTIAPTSSLAFAPVSQKTLGEPQSSAHTPTPSSETVTAASATTTEATAPSIGKTDVVDHSPAQYLQQLRCLFDRISNLRTSIETGQADILDDVARESHTEKLKETKRQVCGIQESLTKLENKKDGVILQASQEMASRIRSQLEAVLQEWSKLSDIHTAIQKQWNRIKDQWRVLQTGLKELTSWLEKAENTLARAKEAPLEQRKTLNEDLESSLCEQQSTLAKVNSALEEVVQNASEANADRLRDNLQHFNCRWKALCSDVLAQHKNSENKDVTTQPADFSQEMDDLYSWIDETENLIGSSLRPSSLYLEDLLEKIKDKKDEVADKQASLFSVNSSGSKLLHSPIVTDEDRAHIQQDIDSLNATWDKVTSDFPEKIRYIEEEIKKVRYLNEDIDAMQKWIVGMRAALERQAGQASQPDDDDTDDEDNDDARIASSFQITSDAIEAQQAKLNQINASFQKQMELCGGQTSDVVDSLQMKIDRMNADFEQIKEMVMKITSQGKAEKNEVMEQVTVSQAQTCTEAKPSAVTVSWPEFEKSLNDLHYWLSVLDHMIRSQKCRVGNVKDIHCKVQTLEYGPILTLPTSVDHRSGSLRHENEDGLLPNSQHAVEPVESQEPVRDLRLSETYFKEMTGKKSQLDQAVATSTELQKSISDVEDKKALADKMEKLKLDWEQAVKDVTRQKHELDKMLEECTHFDQSYAEFELWLGQTECQMDALETELESSDVMSKYEHLQEAINRHKQMVDNLRQKAEKLIEDYPNHDTHQMQLTLLRLTNRWSVLLNRLQDQKGLLQTTQDGRHFETALLEFEIWLEMAEKSAQSLAELSNGFDFRNEEPTRELLEKLE